MDIYGFFPRVNYVDLTEMNLNIFIQKPIPELSKATTFQIFTKPMMEYYSNTTHIYIYTNVEILKG